jgi:hypothetical protein
MRNPFENVSPTRLQLGVAAVAAAHVLAVLTWVVLVWFGIVGTKTAWETPQEPRQPRRRVTVASRSDADSQQPSAAALRRRRRKEKREEEANAAAAAAVAAGEDSRGARGKKRN